MFFEHQLGAGSTAGAECSGRKDTAYMKKLGDWGLGGHEDNTLPAVPSVRVWAVAGGTQLLLPLSIPQGAPWSPHFALFALAAGMLGAHLCPIALAFLRHDPRGQCASHVWLHCLPHLAGF